MRLGVDLALPNLEDETFRRGIMLSPLLKKLAAARHEISGRTKATQENSKQAQDKNAAW